MKKILLFVFSIFLSFSFTLAQDGINYQGAATDVNGDELTNQNISIRASILSGSASGNLEWEETHSTTTDQFGLFNVVIGQGTNTTNGATATFDDMDWGSANHFLKIEMDATGGTNYTMIGTTQMMSVPYALYAKSAGIDSTMLANMIGSSGGGGTGCDYSFPEGIGDPVLFDIGPSGGNYTVPINKNLYITSFNSNYAYGAELQISTHTVYKGQGNRLPQSTSPRRGEPHLPIVASSSEVISSTHDYTISGFLVDKLVEPITIDLNTNYTVPQGKKLIVLNFYSDYGQLTVNSKILLFGYYNYFSSISACQPPCHSASLKMPLFLSDNMLISSSPGEVINGYLVDENYFAGCGGGGSSSGNSGTMSVSTFGDTLTLNGQSIIVPGLSYTNVVPTFGSVTDYDGNTYQTVTIVNQEWMMEDLRVTRFSNGDIIPVHNFGGTWSTWTTPSCHTYSNQVFYNGHATLDSRNVCPTGWHVPSNQEWEDLCAVFGVFSNNSWEPSGKALKNTDPSAPDVWPTSINALNNSFLSINPSGYFEKNSSTRYGAGGTAYIWSSTIPGAGSISRIRLEDQYTSVIFGSQSDYNLQKIRCVKD